MPGTFLLRGLCLYLPVASNMFKITVMKIRISLIISLFFIVAPLKLKAETMDIPDPTDDVAKEALFEAAHDNENVILDDEEKASKQSSDLNPALTIGLKNESYKKTKEWKNYKILRAIGWSLLPVSAISSFVWVVECLFWSSEGGNLFDTETGLIMGALGFLTLSSVGILITAYHFRNKAKKMSISTGITNMPIVSYTGNKVFTPGLSLTLNF